LFSSSSYILLFGVGTKHGSWMTTVCDVVAVQDCLVKTDRNWRACQAGEHLIHVHLQKLKQEVLV
jgi:hypothetical protein